MTVSISCLLPDLFYLIVPMHSVFINDIFPLFLIKAQGSGAKFSSVAHKIEVFGLDECEPADGRDEPRFHLQGWAKLSKNKLNSSGNPAVSYFIPPVSNILPTLPFFPLFLSFSRRICLDLTSPSAALSPTF